jgi:hypothetical protein
MVFGRRREEERHESAPVNGVRAMALITDTEKPLDNMGERLVRSMQGAAARTGILVEINGRAVVATRDLWLDQDHWLTTGMQAPVIVNPEQPDDFVVDWASVPSIEQRASANESSLVDPLGAPIRVWETLAASGHITRNMALVAPSVADVTAPAMKAQLDEAPQLFAQRLATTAQQPAPVGWKRALVLIATTTATLETGRVDGDMNLPHRNSHGKHRVVLSVSVPGQAPYAVFVASFDHKQRAADLRSPGLPALVSATDPSEVKVLWDEMPTLREQRHAGRDAGRAANAAGAERMAAIQQQIAAATSGQSPQLSVPGAAFSPPPTGVMNPAVKASMEQSARYALSQTRDPAMRRMLIERYKSLGLEIDDHE